MKNVVRTLVIALAVTGALASTSFSGSAAKTTAIAGKTSAAPVPYCPPNTPNGCGIGDGW
jgi:hypothetical protein